MGVAEVQINVFPGAEVEIGVVSVVPVDGRAADGQRAILKNAPVIRRTACANAFSYDATVELLGAPGCDVVGRSAEC